MSPSAATLRQPRRKIEDEHTCRHTWVSTSARKNCRCARLVVHWSLRSTIFPGTARDTSIPLRLHLSLSERPNCSACFSFRVRPGEGDPKKVVDPELDDLRLALNRHVDSDLATGQLLLVHSDPRDLGSIRLTGQTYQPFREESHLVFPHRGNLYARRIHYSHSDLRAEVELRWTVTPLRGDGPELIEPIQSVPTPACPRARHTPSRVRQGRGSSSAAQYPRISRSRCSARSRFCRMSCEAAGERGAARFSRSIRGTA